MKFEDALKRIKGAESVGGQLIAYRHGRNVLVGKNVQGTLIVEDEDEAKGIAREVDEKAYEDGREVREYEDDKSILSTTPTEYAIHGTEPMPNVKGDDAQHLTPASAGGEDADARADARKPAKGADPNTPKANTAESSDDKAGQEGREKKQEARDADKSEGKTHNAKFEDRVETRDNASTTKK
jgi:hypothetical protein